MALEGKGAMDDVSKENFGLMTAWMQVLEEAEELSKSPRVLVCETGILRAGKSGRGASSKANLI